MTPNSSHSDLRCPKCLGELHPDDQRLVCQRCHSSFPVRDGIFDLRCKPEEDYYFNPVPPVDMDTLVRGMTRENWQETIRTFVSYTKAPGEWLDNLVVDGRYAWKLLLDLNRDKVLLDLGCGLGNLTHNLAPFVRKVYAADLTYLRLAFSKRRFEIFNPNDDIALLATGDCAHLPLRDGAVDCVVLSGVLEWVGDDDGAPYRDGSKLERLMQMLASHFGERNPRQVQLRFLKEIRRVLKPGGQLFVAIENRFGYEYFKGLPDHHSQLKYSSLLPRLAANLYSIAAKRWPYRTYTYSIPGHKRLMAEAGFPNTEFVGFSRGYSYLEEIMPAEIDAPWWRPAPAEGFKARLRQSKYFVPAYGVIGSAARKPWPRLQDALLSAIEGDLAKSLGAGKIAIESYRITGKDKFLVKGSYGGKNVLMRIPQGPVALGAEKRSAAMRRFLDAADVRVVPSPKMFGSGTVGRQAYFVTEFLPGDALATALLSHGRASVLGEVEALLDALNRVPPGIRRQPFTGDLYEVQVTERLAGLSLVVADPEARRQAADYFHQRLHGVETAVGLTHGDFGVLNILATDGKVTGLVDWEGGSLEGLPILDAISYVATVPTVMSPDDRLDKIVPLLASGNWPQAEERAFLANRYAALGMDPAGHEAWTYLNWLHNINMLLEGHFAYNPQSIERNVSLVLGSMLAKRTT